MRLAWLAIMAERMAAVMLNVRSRDNGDYGHATVEGVRDEVESNRYEDAVYDVTGTDVDDDGVHVGVDVDVDVRSRL